MFNLLVPILIAQTPPAPTPVEVVRPQTIRPLPGEIDSIPMFNSNSPELVQTEGILLSTFPPNGMQSPSAHLNFGFDGRFDVFAHHVYRAPSDDELTSLYLGIILYNPGDRPVTVDILQAASYLSQPDAPFVTLPSWVENPQGDIYAGPGSRVMSDILRGQRQSDIPPQVVISPRDYAVLLNVPIPVATLDPPLNGRSTFMRVRSTNPVYAASLAMRARLDEAGNETAPALDDWVNVLESGDLAGARDRSPTPPDQTTGQVIYGRVAGVSQGSQWQTQLVDTPEPADRDSMVLTIPDPGDRISYGISTLLAGQMGTGQIQSAPMLVRYPDTAYQAHGNYAVEYRLTLPLVNPTRQDQRVTVALETPIKEDNLSE
ncbi:MAG: DUF3370 domain-containing protein, partial [Elainellaceae cyanobacterium]